VASGRAVLSATALSRTYPGPSTTYALRDATFEVHAGDFTTIEGPSGSGKSTLLHLLGLLDRPTAGSYVLAGHDTARIDERERSWLRATAIGFVFQSFHLLDTRSALHNVELALMYRGFRAREAERRAAATLDRVGLGSQLHQLTNTMSGGERQRVAIARALVGEPDVLLCDEPTGNLDSTNGAAVMGLFEELNRQGSTVVLITHDTAVAAAGTRRRRIVDGVLR
jgi:putative ABC transport system ATP-binding protein